MSKWDRISVRFVVSLLAVGVYVYLFGTQNAAALMSRYEFRNMPEAKATPVPLRNLSISSAPHARLSHCGYEFELPWDDVDEQKSRSKGTISVTVFRSGDAFWVSCFPAKDFVNGVMMMSHLDAPTFARVYGEGAAESDYDFYRLMLSMTPASIKPFESRSRAVRDMTLLTMKIIAMPKADSGLFSVQTPHFKGFQFGDPAAHPRRISDELYADDGGVDLIFFQHNSAPAITQPQINRVLESVRRTGPPSR